eukprot:2929125-Amphidinium_carterae.1
MPVRAQSMFCASSLVILSVTLYCYITHASHQFYREAALSMTYAPSEHVVNCQIFCSNCLLLQSPCFED